MWWNVLGLAIMGILTLLLALRMSEKDSFIPETDQKLCQIAEEDIRNIFFEYFSFLFLKLGRDIGLLINSTLGKLPFRYRIWRWR
ncbi:MAG: hypothetical protein ACFFBD_24010 [Candidatus Hodarchaeota archaeon]